jgi:hypothetical protein
MAKDFKLNAKTSLVYNNSPVYIDQAHQQFKLTTTREKEQSSNRKSERQEDRM